MRKVGCVSLVLLALVVRGSAQAYPVDAGGPVANREVRKVGPREEEAPDRRPAFWRGKPPLICRADECPPATATFCFADDPPQALPGDEASRRECVKVPDFRDAARSTAEKPRIRDLQPLPQHRFGLDPARP